VEVKIASQKAINNIKLKEFQRCFTQWEKRLHKYIASNGIPLRAVLRREPVLWRKVIELVSV
jgi:hypothetical protein